MTSRALRRTHPHPVLAALFTLLASRANMVVSAQAAVAPAACAGYTIEIRRDPNILNPDVIRIERGGRTVVTVANGKRAIALCVNVLGDETPEVVTMAYTGGLHCCTVVDVLQLRQPVHRVLHYVGEYDPTPGALRDLDGDGRRELVLTDNHFAYFNDLCFACSPILSLVLCDRNGTFADCTMQFPDGLQRDLRQAEERLNLNAGDNTDARTKYRRGGVLGVYLVHTLLDGEAAAWDAVSARLNERDRVWLSLARSRAQAWAADRLRALDIRTDGGQ